jgi:hypothetical protein
MEMLATNLCICLMGTGMSRASSQRAKGQHVPPAQLLPALTRLSRARGPKDACALAHPGHQPKPPLYGHAARRADGQARLTFVRSAGSGENQGVLSRLLRQELRPDRLMKAQSGERCTGQG